MSLSKEFALWKTQNNQYGGQAFSRFIMLKFLEGLQLTSSDFVFKGGNLLWHYIKTPRQTTDLDLITLNLKSHLEVERLIKESFRNHSEVDFSIKSFTETGSDSQVGADIIVVFKTSSGQQNQFSIDIVYAIPTDISKIKYGLSGRKYKAASIENIICDKLSAAHRFKSGNTRMKDFDDLWRIVKSDIHIDLKKLGELLDEKSIEAHLDLDWIVFLEGAWKRHLKTYKDIPKELRVVFNEVNSFLNKIS